MKFKIRHADKIVGLSIVIALFFLVLVIFLLGSKQEWFSKKYYYVAILESAYGVGENMPVLYKGFSIGNVDSIQMNGEDMVEVRFHVMEKYRNRVRKGSLVEVMASPIGLGNQFFFYPGLGDELAEGSVIPTITSGEGKQLAAQGLSNVTHAADSVSGLIIKINSLLENTNSIVYKLDEAFAGSDNTSLGRVMGSVETTLADVSVMASTMGSTLEPVLKDTKSVLEDAKKVLAHVEVITKEMSDPDGTVLSILDGEGQVHKDLEKTISSLSKTLANLEKTTNVLPGQAPNIAVLIEELRTTLKNANDVLESMKNNPLLRGGIPEKVDTGSGGTSPRDVDF